MPSAAAGAILCLVALGMSAWALVSATGWPLKTGLFPMVVGVPVLVLAAVELYLLATDRTRTPRPQAGEAEPEDADVDPALARRRTLAIFGWIAALFVLVIGLGFVAAVPAFVLLYLRLYGRERWPLSLVLAGAAWALVYGLFVRVLNLPFAEGAVVAWLRGAGLVP